jgi:hypothetical protein
MACLARQPVSELVWALHRPLAGGPADGRRALNSAKTPAPTKPNTSSGGPMQFYSAVSFGNTRCALVAGGVLAVLSLPASAADLTPDTSRDLSDPTFLPLTHHFVGRTSYSSWKSAGEVDDLGRAGVYRVGDGTYFDPIKAMKVQRYRWPGNVRELQNVLEPCCHGW